LRKLRRGSDVGALADDHGRYAGLLREDGCDPSETGGLGPALLISGSDAVEGSGENGERGPQGFRFQRFRGDLIAAMCSGVFHPAAASR
jgi:hypothetical protein